MTDGLTPQPPIVQLKQITVSIESTGRAFVIAVPIDLTDAELLEMSSWMTHPDYGLRSQLQPPSKIVLMDGHTPAPTVKPS